jgi:hypothetical protein
MTIEKTTGVGFTCSTNQNPAIWRLNQQTTKVWPLSIFWLWRTDDGCPRGLVSSRLGNRNSLVTRPQIAIALLPLLFIVKLAVTSWQQVRYVPVIKSIADRRDILFSNSVDEWSWLWCFVSTRSASVSEEGAVEIWLPRERRVFSSVNQIHL